MVTRAERRSIKRALKAVTWLDERMESLCSDPMTRAMGAPVGDFAWDWSRKHRKMLADCLKDKNLERFPKVREELFGAMESYFP